MTEDELSSKWTALEPTVQQRRTIETRVFKWLEAGETSLASQWISLVRIRPVTVFAYAILNALTLLPLSLLRVAVFP